jgi:uncharacterized protein (DUF362 family)
MISTGKSEMTRREFLAAGGGLVALAGAGGAVRTGRAGTQTSSKSRVILVRTTNRAAGVKRCLDLFGGNPFKEKQILVKPNFNTADPTPGSTHNDTLRAILAGLREKGAKGIAIGDRSGPEPTEQVLQKKNIRGLAAEFDSEVINFDELGRDGYTNVNPPGSHWKSGFLVARPVAGAAGIVSTCCLKTHAYGGVFTMSLKNSVGIVPRKDYPYMGELHRSPDQRKMIAEINLAYRPDLVVLDGIEAFVDGGPMEGPKKEAGVFLAGSDRVAVDAVGVAILKDLGSNDAIMKIPVFEQGQIARAVEMGLGAKSPADIVIETGDAPSEAYAEKIRKILNA